MLPIDNFPRQAVDSCPPVNELPFPIFQSLYNVFSAFQIRRYFEAE